MKRVFAGAILMALCVSSAYAFKFGSFQFGAPAPSAEGMLSKFDQNQNGTLGFVYDMQPTAANTANEKSSEFTQLVAALEAKEEFQTCRGALDIIWTKAGEAGPKEGWAHVNHTPTYKEVNTTWPLMVLD